MASIITYDEAMWHMFRLGLVYGQAHMRTRFERGYYTSPEDNPAPIYVPGGMNSGPYMPSNEILAADDFIEDC